MVVDTPGPDVIFGVCPDCHKNTRLFEVMAGHMICLACYRDLVDAVLETFLEEDEDAAT